jgi:hypothetical protein
VQCLRQDRGVLDPLAIAAGGGADLLAVTISGVSAAAIRRAASSIAF